MLSFHALILTELNSLRVDQTNSTQVNFQAFSLQWTMQKRQQALVKIVVKLHFQDLILNITPNVSVIQNLRRIVKVLHIHTN